MCYYITYTATNCDTNKTWNDKAMIDYKSTNLVVPERSKPMQAKSDG